MELIGKRECRSEKKTGTTCRTHKAVSRRSEIELFFFELHHYHSMPSVDCGLRESNWERRGLPVVILVPSGNVRSLESSPVRSRYKLELGGAYDQVLPGNVRSSEKRPMRFTRVAKVLQFYLIRGQQFGKHFIHSLCIYDYNLNSTFSICFITRIHGTGNRSVCVRRIEWATARCRR